MKGLALLFQTRRFIKFFPIWVYVIWPQRYNLNNFGKGPLDEATYQRPGPSGFRQEDFLSFQLKKSIFSYCDLDVQ